MGCRGGETRRTQAARATVHAVAVALVASALTHLAAPAGAAATSTTSGLSAFALLDAAGYASALGQAVQGIEDDGAIPSPPALVSQARSATVSGIVLTVTLSSFASSASARQQYSDLTRTSSGGSAPTPIPGAGDSGSYSAGVAVVLKQSQVLKVEARVGGDLSKSLDAIKERGGDPTAAFADALTTALKLAPALAAHMTGQAVTRPEVVLAKGAINSCGLGPAFKAQPKVGTVTVTPSVSERPPATQCQYQLSTGYTINVFIVTADQLASATPPTDIATVFAADQASAARAGGSVGRSVPVQFTQLITPNIYTQELPEPTAEIRGAKCLVRVTMPGSQRPTRRVTDPDLAALERFPKIANRHAVKDRQCKDDLQRAIESQGDPFSEFQKDIERLQNLTLAELLILAGAGLLL